MATRWNRYYDRQMEDPEMKERVERKLANLRVSAAIARVRQKTSLTQTQLAARTGMSASKISALENSPKNLAALECIYLGSVIFTFDSANSSRMTRFLASVCLSASVCESTNRIAIESFCNCDSCS